MKLTKLTSSYAVFQKPVLMDLQTKILLILNLSIVIACNADHKTKWEAKRKENKHHTYVAKDDSIDVRLSNICLEQYRHMSIVVLYLRAAPLNNEMDSLLEKTDTIFLRQHGKIYECLVFDKWDNYHKKMVLRYRTDRLSEKEYRDFLKEADIDVRFNNINQWFRLDERNSTKGVVQNDLYED